MLNFFGIKKIDIVAADQMALDYEKSIKSAEEKIKELFKD
jgi:FMN-dependent NADH-azoreductase